MSSAEATVWFWAVAGFFTALWVVIPTLLHTSYCGDVIEPLNVAPEWVWATKKHPMLPAWILEILNILTCRSFAVPFIATQLCTLLALWSVWKLGRTVLTERLALIASLVMLPYLFFTCKPIWFNQNNVLIAFWALSIYLVFQALQTNQKRYWGTAGIALGLSFHAKYPAVFLVLSILIYMFTQASGRKLFRTPGPWITTLMAFLIFLPHLIWLYAHDFVTLTYASAGQSIHTMFLTQWNRHIFSPLHFTFLQFTYLFLTLVIMIPVIGFAWQWKIQYHEQGKARECEKFLFYCFMIPFLSHLLYGGIRGVFLPMAYGAAFWTFAGLWLLLRFQQTNVPIQKSFRQVLILTITIMLLIAAGFVTLSRMGMQNPKHYIPMRELGATCEQLWHSRFPATQCPYIIGSNWLLAGHAAHAMTVRPSIIVPHGTWANDGDLNRKGGMIIWERTNGESEMPESLRQRFPKARVLDESPELPYNVGRNPHVLKIGIAVVPPPEAP